MFDVITCPTCRRKLRLPEAHRGSEVQCPACRARFLADAPPADDIPLLQPVSDSDREPAGRRVPEERRPHLPPPRSRELQANPWDEIDAEERPARQRGNGVIGVLVAVVLVVVGFGVLAWQPWKDRKPKREPFVQNAEERRQEIKGAFQADKPLTDDELARELKEFFDDLDRAFQRANADELAARFDVDRLLEEVVAVQPLPPELARNKAGFRWGMRSGIGTSMAKRAPLIQWVRFEIRHVKRLGNGEVIVIARHEKADGTPIKMRWWLIRGAGKWRIYDMEDLEAGMRSSAVMASVLGLDPQKTWELASATNTLVEALMLLAQQVDVDGAERKLKAVEGVRLPPRLESLRYLARGIIHVHRQQFADALKDLDEATRRNPDMPVADLLRGLVFNQQGKWDQAVKHLQAYRELLGDEAVVCRELGLALRGVRRFTEAAACYRAALDRDPKDGDAFLGLLQSLAVGDPVDDITTRFARLGNHQGSFDVCAEECWKNRGTDALERLALAMRKLDPGYAPADHYLSLVRARAGQAAQAVTLHRSTLARQKDAKLRAEYERQFLEAMADSGKVVEAYAAAADARAAFRILAARAHRSYVRDNMKQLLAAHARKHADDPLLLLYQGEQYAQQQQYKLADEAFTAAVGKRLDAATLHSFRYSRVLARYRLGQGLSAYRDIGPRNETFTQLARLCLGQKDYAQLQALLDAHTRNEPNSKDIVQQRLRMHIRQQKIAEGSALLKEALAKRNKQEAEALVAVFLSEMVQAGRRLEGYRAAPDARQAFRLLMEERYGGADSKKERRKLLEVHRERHPDDPWLLYWTGVFQVEDRAWPAAAATFEKVWEAADKPLRSRMRWWYARALYQTGSTLGAYRQLGADKDIYTTLAGMLCADKKGAELEELIRAHRPKAGDDPLPLFHAARAKVFLKQPAEAVALFQQAYRTQPWGPQRRTYLTTFVQDMAGIGRGLDAYRAAADKTLAFETLARSLVFKKNADELAKLLAEHGKAQGGAPLALYYRGEWHLLRGEAALAETSFRAALKGARAQNQWMFRNGLYRACIKAGRAAATYEELGREAATFETLAGMCVSARDVRQLAALIAVHRKAHPKDANLVARDLDLKWLSKDYDGVLKLLAEDRGGVLSQRFRWKANDYRVRCLVRLKRAKEALREAEALRKKNEGSDLLLVLASAAQGDGKRTAALVEKLSPRPWLIGSFYTDEDLGPIVKSEAFRVFREKFPAPKDNGQPSPDGDDGEDD